MPTVATTPDADYVLGHSDNELRRLVRQSQFFNPLTEPALRQAGIAEGMRVLDVGCGAGDVSFLAASMVGLRGMVIGIDTSAEAVALATARANAAGLANVHFLTRDITDLQIEPGSPLDQPVDALIGRLVLMYLADPASTLRRLIPFVRPGGLVVFQDVDTSGATSEPECPTFALAVRRIEHAFLRAGADCRAGLKLPRIFREAGLAEPHILHGARAEAGADSLIYEQVAMITRSLQPLMERTGLATAEEIDSETLADRLRDEALTLGATLVSPSLISAWTRVEA